MPNRIVKIKIFLKKLPQLAAEHLFLSFLISFLLVLALGFFVFYRYSILTEREGPAISESQMSFDEQSYQELSKIWQDREKRLTEDAISDIKIRFAEPL